MLSKSPLYWRRRAEEIRLIRDDTRNSHARAILGRIARDYERMAGWADPIDREVMMTRIADGYGQLTDLDSGNALE